MQTRREFKGNIIILPWLALVFLGALLFVVIVLADDEEPVLTVDFSTLIQLASSRFGPDPARTLAAWQLALEDVRDRPEREQLQAVNRFIHRHVTYAEDSEVWGVSDYWATPLETLGMGRGDCEDYVIAKYVSLLHLGVPDEKLRLIYVRARIGGDGSPLSRAHMVLAYYETPTADPLILDSLLPDIRPASQRPDLTPVFSFNSEGLWIGTERAQGTASGRLSRWRDALMRMTAEGIHWHEP